MPTRDMWGARALSRGYYGFSLLLVCDSIVNTWLYPNPRDAVFWIMQISFIGGGIYWSYRVGRGLSRGASLTNAFALLGVVSYMIAVGAVLAQNPAHQMQSRPMIQRILRSGTGCYVLFLWILALTSAFRRARLPAPQNEVPVKGTLDNSEQHQ